MGCHLNTIWKCDWCYWTKPWSPAPGAGVGVYVFELLVGVGVDTFVGARWVSGSLSVSSMGPPLVQCLPLHRLASRSFIFSRPPRHRPCLAPARPTNSLPAPKPHNQQLTHLRDALHTNTSKHNQRNQQNQPNITNRTNKIKPCHHQITH